ncbi:MAG TPA: GTPase HflX [Candidatus Eisenbacteria bacterium]|nr:GTPase HflX [Candidatus Eisenbacteria bacterium]
MQEKTRAIVLGVYQNTEPNSKKMAENSLSELIELAETAGLEVVGEALQARPKLDPAYAAGKGKLEEIAELAETMDVDTIVLDLILSGSQMRNISELTDLIVLDRTLIILDIFASRAKTKEGQLQVEIAQLNDRATRLIGAGQVLSRLAGGIGTRGPGETQLETDRRHIQRRIKHLQNRLIEVRKRRDLTRENRDKNQLITAAVVGYTNAGKSTLMNILCESDQHTMNQVFATLDPTARRLKQSDIPILLIDTVGFIRKLPHQLVEAFQSTLDEVTHADIIVEVTDLSDPEYEIQMDIVERQLETLEANTKPRIHVFNKIDLVESSLIKQIKSLNRHDIKQIFTSAKEGIGIDELRQAIIEIPKKQMLPFHLVIPYDQGNILDELRQTAYIESIAYTDQGTEVSFRIHHEHLGIIDDLLN